jgi:hypothetical protein
VISTILRIRRRQAARRARHVWPGLLAVSLGLTVVACSSASGNSSAGGSGGAQSGSGTSAQQGSSPAGLTDLSATVDLSLGGNGFPLTMKAPAGSAAGDDGGGGVEIQQSGGGHFNVDVQKVTTSFASIKQQFQSMPAPYAFVKFIVDQPGEFIYEIHNTASGEPANTFQYSAYVMPAGAPGYACSTFPGATDSTLLSQQGAEAVLAACKTLEGG